MEPNVPKEKKTLFNSRGGKSHNTAIIILAVVIVGGLFAYSQGWIKAPTTTASVTPAVVTNNPAGQVVATATGNIMANQLVTMTVAPTNQLTAAGLTEGTGPKHTWLLKSLSGTFSLQSTGTPKTINVSPDGKVWAQLSPSAAGQEYIFSPKYTAQSEPRFNNDCVFIDYTNTGGVKHFVCSFNTNGLTPQQSNYGVIPTMNLNTKWLNDGTVSASSPSDISSIGTTANTAEYSTYTITGTAGKVTLLTRLQLVFNSTADSKWSASQSFLYFKDAGITKTLDTFQKTQDSSNTYYSCYLDSNFNCQTSTDYSYYNAYPMEFSNNGPGTITLQVKTMFSLASSDKITENLKIDSANSVNGANTQVTDSILYSA